MNKKKYKTIPKIYNNSPEYIAAIGWQASFNEELVYTLGYIDSWKTSGDLLVEQFLPDLLVFPIMFSYRQYLELCLKNICYRCLGTEEYQIFMNSSSHNLQKIWSEAKKHLHNFDITNQNHIDFIENAIKDFHNLDTGSFNFRYPQDKQLKLNIKKLLSHPKSGKDTTPQMIINLKLLKEQLDFIDLIIRHTYDSL